MEQINSDIVYYSAYDGPYNIIQDLGYYDDGQRKVLIKFIETGNTQESRLYRAKKGQVRDKNKRTIDNDIHHSNNSGDFIYLEYLGSMGTDHAKCKIKFLYTGREYIVDLSMARKGSVVDPFYPSVAGVGFTGNIVNPSKHPFYQTWYDMHDRCYNPSSKAYSTYGGAGVTVCERWHNFENFIQDAPYLPGYNEWLKGGYELDKDTLQSGIPSYLKVYSPQTCCFIPKEQNMRKMLYDKSQAGLTTSQYIGVSQDPGKPNYRCSMTINGKKYGFGTYTSEVAAAHVYNNKGRLYNSNATIFNNDLPYMSPEEIANSRRPITPLIKPINKR